MNSSERIAAQRYAAAYNELSSSTQEAVRRAADLQAAAQALAAVQTVMQSPRVPTEEKKKAVRAALQAIPQTAAFVELLLEAKRYSLLRAITQEVQLLAEERQGIVRAEVLSARELTSAQKQETEQALSARYNAKVAVSFAVNPALLGGLKIWCRGELIDGSLQGRLAKLQEELTH